MTILDILCDLADLFDTLRWWRVYVCLAPAIGLACVLHAHWPEAYWLYCLTIPSVIGALVLGLRWQSSCSS